MKRTDGLSKRSVLVTNVLPPYRLPAFEALSRMPNIELHVWLMAQSETGRKWPTTFENFDVEIFSDIGGVIHFNPGMLWRLGREPVDTVILGGVDSVTTIVAAILLKIRQVPIIFWVEDTDQQTYRLRQLLEPAIAWVLRLSSAVVVPGRGATDFVTRLGVSQNSIFVAPNSVSPERFAPVTPLRKEALRRKLQLPEGRLCLCVGQLIHRKGMVELITAFKSVLRQLPEACLVVVGDGALQRRLMEGVASDPASERRIRFVGHCPEESLPEYYAASDLFVFPTLSDAWGLVLNEAMSTGLACVCSQRAGASLDLIEDGITGLLWKPDQGEPLEQAISRLLRDDHLRNALGENPRARIISNFTPAHQAQGMARAIFDVSDNLLKVTSRLRPRARSHTRKG